MAFGRRICHPAATLLLITLIDLLDASPPVIEAGHYEGRVDPNCPIGTLRSIAMDVSSARSDEGVLISDIKLRGSTSYGKLKVVANTEVKWKSVPALSDVLAAVGPDGISRVDHCYEPVGMGEHTEQKLERSYDVFSIPHSLNQWERQLKLCSIAGSWYIFLCTYADDLLLPVLMVENAKRIPELNTLRRQDQHRVTHATRRAVTPLSIPTREETTLSTFAGVKDTIAPRRFAMNTLDVPTRAETTLSTFTAGRVTITPGGRAINFLSIPTRRGATLSTFTAAKDTIAPTGRARISPPLPMRRATTLIEATAGRAVMPATIWTATGTFTAAATTTAGQSLHERATSPELMEVDVPSSDEETLTTPPFAGGGEMPTGPSLNSENTEKKREKKKKKNRRRRGRKR